MNHSPLLGPIVALVAWTLVIQVWLYAARIPAMRRGGIDIRTLVGTRGNDLERLFPLRSAGKPTITII